MNQAAFNHRLRQIIILVIIILLGLLLLKQLYIFMPGFLGAITLYIIFRERFFRQTFGKKRNKTRIALLYILLSIVVIALPVWLSIEMISDKISFLVNNQDLLIADAKIVGQKIKETLGYDVLSEGNLAAIQKRLATIVPAILNSSAGILSNFAIMFFLLYFMLKNGRDMESFFNKFIPLKKENINLLSTQTKSMIKANAIGIPVLAIIQGIVATLGYWIFGVQDFWLWGFLTGVCSLIPILGTAIVWVPLCLYLYSINQTGHSIGLLIYAVALITNIDYVVRLTLLKRYMDIHPIITIFGVITGIGLFGFWGVIFGPLLITYLVILIKIYINEFGNTVTIADEQPLNS
jgi:predicted PurR-regulated permease PerM